MPAKSARTAPGGAAIALVAGLALALAGCGSSGSASSASSTSPTPTINPGGPRRPVAPRDSLRIDYWPHGQGLDGSRVWTLTCRPTGGSHPAAAAACRELAARQNPFSTPRIACPMVLIRGAPVAEVRGRLGGRPVFALVRPVCGTKWKRLHALLTGR